MSEENHDIFISYARKDNTDGLVTALKLAIEDEFRAFCDEPLNCFMDTEEIKDSHDWEMRLLRALNHSHMLLLVLSPDYLKRDYCGWEITEYLKFESWRSVGGEGVTPVYFVEIPGLDEPGFEQRCAEWVARVKRRQRVDLRPWRDAGIEALKNEQVRKTLTGLRHGMFLTINRQRLLEKIPTNIPGMVAHFVGRTGEMRELHEAVHARHVGVLTAVKGYGGVGKTALATQYSYAYATSFPGGRWKLDCAGALSMASALRKMDVPLRLEFSQEDKVDDVRAAVCVLNELRRRSLNSVGKPGDVPDSEVPAVLLLMDNVDNSEVLANTDLVRGYNWLHVVATTRMAGADFGFNEGRHRLVDVDVLPTPDALDLIRQYLPGGKLEGAELEAATRIVEDILGGFTLAVENVAVYLREQEGRVTCADLLLRLEKEGLSGLEAVAGDAKARSEHGERLLGATLRPTLELLAGDAQDGIKISMILCAASMLPPDMGPLPWVRELLATIYPELGAEVLPGYPDPWLRLINRLVDMRLLSVAEMDDEGRYPRICRMHRIVQAVVRDLWDGVYVDSFWKGLWNRLLRRKRESLSMRVRDRMGVIVAGRSTFVRENWFKPECRWEIESLAVCAAKFLDDGLSVASVVAGNAASCLDDTGDYAGARALYERALEGRERVLRPDHPSTLGSVNNLALVLGRQGDYAGARALYERALEGNERVLGPDHPSTLTIVNNLAFVLESQGDYAGARTLYERALEGNERVLGLDHPDTLGSVNNLAGMLFRQGDYAEARPLYERAQEGYERVLGPDHPSTLTSVNNLAATLESQGDYAGACTLYERALEGRERVLGPDHPDTLTSVNNLAGVLYRQGDYAGARTLFERAVEGLLKLSVANGRTMPDLSAAIGNYQGCLEKLGLGADEIRGIISDMLGRYGFSVSSGEAEPDGGGKE